MRKEAAPRPSTLMRQSFTNIRKSLMGHCGSASLRSSIILRHGGANTSKTSETSKYNSVKKMGNAGGIAR